MNPRVEHPIRNHEEDDYDCRSDEKDFFLIKFSIVRHAANLLGVRQSPIVELSFAGWIETADDSILERSCPEYTRKPPKGGEVLFGYRTRWKPGTPCNFIDCKELKGGLPHSLGFWTFSIPPPRKIVFLYIGYYLGSWEGSFPVKGSQFLPYLPPAAHFFPIGQNCRMVAYLGAKGSG